MADLLFTCSDDNIRRKFIFGSYIPNLWFLSTVSTPVWWLTDTHSPKNIRLNRAGVVPEHKQGNYARFQTEMTTKRQNLRTAALNETQKISILLMCRWKLILVSQKSHFYKKNLNISNKAIKVNILTSIFNINYIKCYFLYIFCECITLQMKILPQTLIWLILLGSWRNKRSNYYFVCVCLCVCVCVYLCMRACVRACVRACT